MDVAPNGDLYVTDGYASDYIHRFDRAGKYLASFGGKKAPYSFNTLHKLAIDTRFQPRAHHRLRPREQPRRAPLARRRRCWAWWPKDLLLPAAVVIYGDYAIVGELRGRVTMLDKAGPGGGTRSARTRSEGVGGNKLPPEQWRTGLVVSPHGVAINAQRRSVRLRIQRLRPGSPIHTAVTGAATSACAAP